MNGILGHSVGHWACIDIILGLGQNINLYQLDQEGYVLVNTWYTQIVMVKFC